MIKSSIGHVTETVLLPLGANARGIEILAFVLLRVTSLPAPLHTVARVMSKRPMPPFGTHPVKRKNPGQTVKHLQPWQILAQDIPKRLGEQPLDPELFVYVRVAMFWPDKKRASLEDIRMSEAKKSPARFFAFFTGDCTGFFHSVAVPDQLCLYLSGATLDQAEGRCEQNTLNLPFTLTWDKTCQVKRVERGLVGRPITFPTCA